MKKYTYSYPLIDIFFTLSNRPHFMFIILILIFISELRDRKAFVFPGTKRKYKDESDGEPDGEPVEEGMVWVPWVGRVYLWKFKANTTSGDI